MAYGTKHRDGCGDIVVSEADAALIAAARNALPALLTALDTARADLDMARASLECDATEIARLREALDFEKDCREAADRTGREMFDQRNTARDDLAAATRRAEVAEARLALNEATRVYNTAVEAHWDRRKRLAYAEAERLDERETTAAVVRECAAKLRALGAEVADG